MEFTNIQKAQICELYSLVDLTFQKFLTDNHRASRILYGF